MKWLALVLLAASLDAADHPEAAFRAAAEALARGELAAAERGFREVLKAQPNHVGALGNLGVVYSRMDRPADAIAVYRRALKLSPNEPGLLLNLGLAHLKQEDYAAAKPLFLRLGTPQSRELLATCQLYTGEERAALATLETLPQTAGVLFLLGSGYLKTGQRDKAEAAFRELLTSAASPAQAHFLMGKAYYDGTLFEEARAAFRRAAELDPRLPSIHLELGKTYVSLRDNDAAERELRAALPSAEASYYLGALLVQTGREAEAIPLLETARAVRPEGWGAWYYLGRAKLQAGEAAAAVPLLERAAKLNAREASIYYQLARAYRASGRPKEAKTALERLKQLRP